ncbi:hypothetical protein C0993_006946 [Termitomyces sp. T159_Od127]|nr:hypothetical protein C0993_006946 [Termitomyces sp. T159_Od127]
MDNLEQLLAAAKELSDDPTAPEISGEPRTWHEAKQTGDSAKWEAVYWDEPNTSEYHGNAVRFKERNHESYPLSSAKRVGNNGRKFVRRAVAAKSHQRLSQGQNGGDSIHDVDTWDNSPYSTGERVNWDSVSHPLRKAKGPQRLPKDYEEETAPALAHKVKSSMTPDAQRAAEGTTSAGTGSQTYTADPLHAPPLPSNTKLNMEARGLDIEDLEARTFDDVERLLGRNFFHDVKANYRARKAEYYETKAAEEKALAGIQTPSSSGGEALNPDESLPGEITARGYDDAEIRTRDLVQSLNAAADTIFRKKLTASAPVVARDSLDSFSSELQARESDDVELDARDNIFEQIGRGVGAVMDTLKGKTPASSHRSVSSVPIADSSLGTESSTGESAPVMAHSIVDQESLDSRDLEAMELLERDLDEELAARGYDVADLKARNIFLSGLENILSSKKSIPSVDHSMVTPSHHSLSHHSLSHHSSSRHSSMDSDSYANENPPMSQHDFAHSEYLEAHDVEEDDHEPRDLNETEYLERSIREELAARGYDDGDLEARFLSRLGKVVSGKKSTSSGHSSTDTYSDDDERTALVQRDLVDGEYLDSRDLDTRDFEEELDARDFEIDELD